MTESEKHKLHSADYFGEQRDFWWNADFLELMGKRWKLDEVNTVLDVSCGIGHWGQTLAPILPISAKVTGIDREIEWIEQARQRVQTLNIADRFSYTNGEADNIPFADGTFDMVTCQTLLIHTKSPLAVIKEMLRVVKSGGLIVVAEPNNIANSLLFDSTNFEYPVEQICDRVRFQLMCERGKAALGEGNNSIGDLLPGCFASLGITNIQVYLSDKAFSLFPPYKSKEQQVLRQQYLDWIKENFWIWNREESQKFFIAGGGTDREFELYWQQVTSENKNREIALLNNEFSTASGSILYLVSGRKSTIK